MEWVADLRKRLELIRGFMQEKEIKAKEAMKRSHDAKAKHELEVGSLVLTKVPGLVSKPGKVHMKL